MKIAILLNNNEITTLHEKKVQVVIFNMEKNKVIGVENTILEDQTKESIINWLHQKSINQIYVLEIDEHTQHIINSKGIRVKTLENLEDDKLYNSLALSSFQLEELS